MTPRMWKWTGALLAIGVLLLVLAWHARATWHQPANSVQVMTLGQLLGFLVSAALIGAAAVILVSGMRRDRARRRAVRAHRRS